MGPSLGAAVVLDRSRVPLLDRVMPGGARVLSCSSPPDAVREEGSRRPEAAAPLLLLKEGAVGGGLSPEG